MIIFTKIPLNDWNMLLKYVFRSKLLETLEDGLIYSFKTFLGVEKYHVFRKKKYGTLEDALTLIKLHLRIS